MQGELEAAAERLFGGATRVELAGRTDAGVHAIGQVAAFSADTALEPNTVERALNAHLPEDVAVRDVREVPEGFRPSALGATPLVPLLAPHLGRPAAPAAPHCLAHRQPA